MRLSFLLLLWGSVTMTAIGQNSNPTYTRRTTASWATATKANPVQAQTADKPADSRKTNTEGFAHLHLTIGPELAYYPGALNTNRAWLNDSTGFGMKQNVGASLRVDYLFFSRLGVSLTAGYYGWELVRRYTRNGVDQYSETKRLTQIPVQLGLKLYPFSQFYVMPEGGTTLTFASIQTSADHPEPTDESVRSTPITYGGSLGYEIRAKALLVDLSVRYQILTLKNFSYLEVNQHLDEQITTASFRIGIGFSSSKK